MKNRHSCRILLVNETVYTVELDDQRRPIFRPSSPAVRQRTTQKTNQKTKQKKSDLNLSLVSEHLDCTSAD